jgi:hypothetical protein
MRHPMNPTDATQNPTPDDDTPRTNPDSSPTDPGTPPHEPERDPTADIDLEGQITDTPTGPEITIYPTDATGATILTTWLTLDANALCDTHDWR